MIFIIWNISCWTKAATLERYNKRNIPICQHRLPASTTYYYCEVCQCFVYRLIMIVTILILAYTIRPTVGAKPPLSMKVWKLLFPRGPSANREFATHKWISSEACAGFITMVSFTVKLVIYFPVDNFWLLVCILCSFNVAFLNKFSWNLWTELILISLIRINTNVKPMLLLHTIMKYAQKQCSR